MTKFESIRIGEVAELSRKITQGDIERFVDLTGDNNKLHVDDNYASATSIKKPVAHGMLGASFISTVIGTKLPGDGALWFSQTLEFLLPVRVGDQITVRAEVIKKHEASATIEMQTDIFNQHRQKVTAGTAKVRVIEQAPPTENLARAGRKRAALVIGASGGIGNAICRQLAADGLGLAIHYHSNEKGAAKLQKEIRQLGSPAVLLKADVTDEKQTKELVENAARSLGSIDVLVVCATSKVPAVKILDLQWRDFQTHLDVNIRGLFGLLKGVVPLMEKAGHGKIIALTTQYIENTPPRDMLPYVTAKSALHGFCKSIAVDLAPKGISVNMVSPGMTETDLIADVPEKIRLLTAAKAPLRRLAQPEDVANAVSFLASERTSYLTGETIRVSGGQVMI